MALGARSGDVVRMVLGRMLLLAAAGLAVGIAGALFATRALEKMLYEVKPDDPSTMVAVAAILAAAAIAASWLPARRAARVDPLVALRWE
jgi:ABC-type antimicrobial peptide transport system permease subunit